MNQPTEKQFTAQVLQFAKLHGWRSAHFRPAMTRGAKWRTAVQGDGAGFPDLVLVRNYRLIFAELKVGKNKLTDEQRGWLTALEMVNEYGSFVWTPADWPEIERVLRG